METLKLMIEASKHIQGIYINNVWTSMGAFLVAFGWLLTSVEARDYLKNHQNLLSYTIGMIVSLFIIHALVSGASWCDSHLLFIKMQNFVITYETDCEVLKEIPLKSTLIALYKIPWYWPPLSLIINGAIVILLLKKLNLLKCSK